MPGERWLKEIIEQPGAVLELLENLKNDSSPHVRRHLAANLYDLLKRNPDPVYQVIERWQNDASPETQGTITQALRYQIKVADPRALRLIGYVEPKVKVIDLGTEDGIFSFSLLSLSNQTQQLQINYAGYLWGRNHRRYRKVRRLSRRQLRANQKANYQIRLDGRWHQVEILVNGQVVALKKL